MVPNLRERDANLRTVGEVHVEVLVADPHRDFVDTHPTEVVAGALQLLVVPFGIEQLQEAIERIAADLRNVHVHGQVALPRREQEAHAEIGVELGVGARG